MTMNTATRLLTGIAVLATTSLAHAGSATWQIVVPEVGTTGSLAALTVVGVVAAAVWERRRKK